jgi:hypothetical protein
LVPQEGFEPTTPEGNWFTASLLEPLAYLGTFGASTRNRTLILGLEHPNVLHYTIDACIGGECRDRTHTGRTRYPSTFSRRISTPALRLSIVATPCTCPQDSHVRDRITVYLHHGYSAPLCIGASDRIRTCGPLLGKQVCWPLHHTCTVSVVNAGCHPGSVCCQHYSSLPQCCQPLIFVVWRIVRDSNPRYLAVHTGSNRALSASQPTIRANDQA